MAESIPVIDEQATAVMRAREAIRQYAEDTRAAAAAERLAASAAREHAAALQSMANFIDRHAQQRDRQWDTGLGDSRKAYRPGPAAYP